MAHEQAISGTFARRWTALSLSALFLASTAACGPSSSRQNDRWVTTENSTVDIDWDAIGKAYKEAEGPEDFERRVNEIYTGDEVISISVRDQDDTRQIVTGFFDKNTNGAPDEGEKVFSLQRDLKSQDSGQYQISGHGAYSHYRSPIWDIAAGMMLGSMISRAFSPGYRPMYTTPYVTPVSRHSTLRSSRDSYRRANPSKFSRKGTASKSGRSYGRSERSFGGGRSRSAGSRRGGGFGRKASSRPRVRLSSRVA